LFEEAIKKNLLLNFKETDEQHIPSGAWHTTLLPHQLRFDTYPWEWNFDQLKDAALTTLKLCMLALNKGMILKDATPLNIRLSGGKMKWIDHLSFEKYKDGEAWIAYRQFCEMFLNPLLISSYCGMEVHRLAQAYPGGIPSETTAKLLPVKCKLRLHIQLHVYLQAGIQRKNKNNKATEKTFTINKIQRILESLQSCINSLTLPSSKIIWSNYYNETILSKDYLEHKKNVVSHFIQNIPYATVLDAGCNDGTFSLLCKPEAEIIAADSDSICINQLYRRIKQEKLRHILPAVIDLTFPPGGYGWNNSEYPAFLDRKEYDLVLALALIHHLCIGKNIPMQKIAAFFDAIATHLVIEFIPKEDPKVQEMLYDREDIFDAYTESEFELCFGVYFIIAAAERIKDSHRKIYKMKRK
jgi:ribosomal protein L11 methylase PrmA